MICLLLILQLLFFSGIANIFLLLIKSVGTLFLSILLHLYLLLSKIYHQHIVGLLDSLFDFGLSLFSFQFGIIVVMSTFCISSMRWFDRLKGFVKIKYNQIGLAHPMSCLKVSPNLFLYFT